jgi:UDP-N-acetylglucosamine 2-epimerase (non-hydrolysing)
MRLINVVGARPNFIKIAPLIWAIRKHNRTSSQKIETLLVHTGQHYDYEMSKVFFQNLELPEPDIHLGVGSGTHSEQVGRIMIEFEKVLLQKRPDLVIVVGDVNSTLACALSSAKLNIPVAHVEAGVRSFDRSMPEEINRVVTDSISTYLFTPTPEADEILRREGIPSERIFRVGDVMVDALFIYIKKVKSSPILENIKLSNGFKTKKYAILTLHRPANVDHKDTLSDLLKACKIVSERMPIIFPIHPRTKKQLRIFGLEGYIKDTPVGSVGIYGVEACGYLDFLKLMMNSTFVMTDSGGIQKETSILGIPCLTLRNTTEWNVTITHGTNRLVSDHKRLTEEAFRILNRKPKRRCIHFELWDGKASERIIKVLTRQNLRDKKMEFMKTSISKF